MYSIGTAREREEGEKKETGRQDTGIKRLKLRGESHANPLM